MHASDRCLRSISAKNVLFRLTFFLRISSGYSSLSSGLVVPRLLRVKFCCFPLHNVTVVMAPDWFRCLLFRLSLLVFQGYRQFLRLWQCRLSHRVEPRSWCAGARAPCGLLPQEVSCLLLSDYALLLFFDVEITFCSFIAFIGASAWN